MCFQIRHSDYIRPSVVYAAAAVAVVVAAVVAASSTYNCIQCAFVYLMRVQSSHASMAPKVENISLFLFSFVFFFFAQALAMILNLLYI